MSGLFTSSDERQPLSRKKKVLFSVVLCSFFIAMFLALGEVGLRARGHRPWIAPEPYISIEPAGNYFIPDPIVGHLPRPGKTTITLAGPYSFTMTHLAHGLRITHPLNTYGGQPKKEVWIFGCSFTHGWSLNDEQTYPWLLQANLPNYEVVNFGVEAFSTVQSYLQFQEALKQRQNPVLVILAYASMHDERNTLTRSWMKRRTPRNRGYGADKISLPYLKWSPGKKPELMYKPLRYDGVPLLDYSSLANFVDDSYNGLLDKTYHSNEISRIVIEDFASLCRANGIEFLVAGIVSDPTTAETLKYLETKGIITTDISVDLGAQENTNLPYDGHPSAIANLEYARKLTLSLCGKVRSESLCGN